MKGLEDEPQQWVLQQAPAGWYTSVKELHMKALQWENNITVNFRHPALEVEPAREPRLNVVGVNERRGFGRSDQNAFGRSYQNTFGRNNRGRFYNKRKQTKRGFSADDALERRRKVQKNGGGEKKAPLPQDLVDERMKDETLSVAWQGTSSSHADKKL